MLEQSISRRRFLETGLVGGSLGTMLIHSLTAGKAETPAAEPPKTCVTLCNHWSYIGIGWLLGIESSVVSVTDAMGMADLPPHVKTCINLDALAYELLTKKFPEVSQRLKKYLAEGKVELIGGSYGQPLGTMFSGESNIRQLIIGRNTIRKALGYEVSTFLEQEEFSHPQMPQIISGAGYRYCSLAQCDTWGRAGCPVFDANIILWEGIDGTGVPCIPKNSLFAGHPPQLMEIVNSPGFKKLAALGTPLIFTWEEFGWEPAEQPDYPSVAARYKEFADHYPVEFVTCTGYLDKYGTGDKQRVYFPMDSWKKVLAWGIGGDQLRICDRKVEGLLLAAETFDAIAAIVGIPPASDAHLSLLENAWKDLLAAQSHDVALCEYSRWQRDLMPPFDRLEDKHNFTWGTIGYQHLDTAERQANTVLNTCLDEIAKRLDAPHQKHSSHVVSVFNACGWERSGVVLTGRIELPEAISEETSVVVKDRSGRVLPAQIVKLARNGLGQPAVAEVAFLAESVPGVGYNTFYLNFTKDAPSGTPPVHIDESALILENEYIRIKLSPISGGVSSLLEKHSGCETLNSTEGAFPTFYGTPNTDLPLRPTPPSSFNSFKSTAKIDWLEKGPVRAIVRARHEWPHLKFETRVILTAGEPCVEVISRILSFVPPRRDERPRTIKEGYWFSLVPAFQPSTILRDFPLAVEPTQNNEFHALSFVDLVGNNVGLLILHAGTQWFRRDATGSLSNLVMREWESHFTGEFGWPLYAEYRHALLPHNGKLTNAERLRYSAAFCRPLLVKISRPHQGVLPPAASFVKVSPPAAQLLALRRVDRSKFEIRVVEVAGKASPVSIELGFPVAEAHETNLLGSKLAEVPRLENRLNFSLQPWKIRTFVVSTT